MSHWDDETYKEVGEMIDEAVAIAIQKEGEKISYLKSLCGRAEEALMELQPYAAMRQCSIQNAGLIRKLRKAAE